MQDLHLIGVHEDGEHLLLGDGSGGEFRLRLDDAVRSALRTAGRPATTPGGGAAGHGALSPRAVQAMIRAGASSEEAAERAGWTVEKVHRYDGPILAERAHIATAGGRVRLRGRYGDQGTTLADRVAERLAARGVAAEEIVWDAHRAEDGPWSVVVRFTAGGRAREATWRYSRQAGTMHAVDDEALWLSADDDTDSAVRRAGAARPPAGARGPHRRGERVTAGRSPSADPAETAAAAPPPPAAPTVEVAQPGPLDLMDSVRNSSRAARRRGGTARRAPAVDVALSSGAGSSPSDLPTLPDPAGDEALPLAVLRYDPETMPPPPGAHSDPRSHEADGRPEPAAAAARPARRPRRAGKPAPPRAAAPASSQSSGSVGPAHVAEQAEASDPGPDATVTPDPSAAAAEVQIDAPAQQVGRSPRRRSSPKNPAPGAEPVTRPIARRTATAALPPDAATEQPGAAESSESRPSTIADSPAGDAAPGTAEETAPAAAPDGAEGASPEPTSDQVAPRPSVESDSVHEPQLPWTEGGVTAAHAPTPARKATPRSKGRAGVPSWDDIMFGSRGKE